MRIHVHYGNQCVHFNLPHSRSVDSLIGHWPRTRDCQAVRAVHSFFGAKYENLRSTVPWEKFHLNLSKHNSTTIEITPDFFVTEDENHVRNFYDNSLFNKLGCPLCIPTSSQPPFLSTNFSSLYSHIQAHEPQELFQAKDLFPREFLLEQRLLITQKLSIYLLAKLDSVSSYMEGNFIPGVMIPFPKFDCAIDGTYEGFVPRPLMVVSPILLFAAPDHRIGEESDCLGRGNQVEHDHREDGQGDNSQQDQDLRDEEADKEIENILINIDPHIPIDRPYSPVPDHVLNTPPPDLGEFWEQWQEDLFRPDSGYDSHNEQKI